MRSKSKESNEKSSVKWSADNISTFLNCYVNYELLWNIRHLDYGTKAKRESAIIMLKDELIALGLAVPNLSFLRSRIKTIKTTYKNELLKVTESEKGGTGAVYVPKLYWFTAADSFLRDVVITRKSTSNLKAKKDSDSDNERESEPEQTVEETIVPSLIPATSSQHYPNTIPKRALKEDSEQYSAPKKQKLRERDVERNSAATSDTPNVPKTLPTNDEHDEVTTFFAFVAAKVKKYSSRTRNAVEHAIFDILKKADAGGYESDP